jgi:hypothetical protein
MWSAMDAVLRKELSEWIVITAGKIGPAASLSECGAGIVDEANKQRRFAAYTLVAHALQQHLRRSKAPQAFVKTVQIAFGQSQTGFSQKRARTQEQ